MTKESRPLSRRAITQALGLAALGSVVRLPAVHAADLEISIALSSDSLAYGGIGIAEKAGLFQKNGLAPRITRMTSGNAATAALIGGSVQFCGSGMEEVIAARARGQKIAIVSNIYRGISGVLVLAKDKAAALGVSPSAPAAARLKALDGLSIATPSATSGFNAPLRAAIERNGAKISYIAIAQPAMAAALKSGAIAAFMASSPFWEPAVLQNFGTIWLSTPKPGELPDDLVPIGVAVLQTTESFAQANPEPIARLRAMFDDLSALIKERPDQARKLLAEAYPKIDAQALKLAFDVNAISWARPVITPADIDHQFKITAAAGVIKDIDKVDRAAVLWKR